MGRKETARVAALLKGSAEAEAHAILDRLVGEGLVRVEGDRLALSPAGEARAQAVVRSHRLTERLLVDVLGVSRQESDRTACLMEHVSESGGDRRRVRIPRSSPDLSAREADPSQAPAARNARTA